MPIPLDEALAEARADLLDSRRLVRAVAAGRRRGGDLQWRRAELRPVEVKAGARLQVTVFDERQAHTANHAWGAEADAAVDDLLAQPFGNWHVDTTDGSIQIRVTKRGEALVHRGDAEREQVADHDRSKRRLIHPTEPFLAELGLSTDDGRIKPSRVDKYRQIEEFVRALEPVAPRVDPLRVVDLGCGNAYLTFACFRYLTTVSPGQVSLVGVDVKQQAREHNAQVAQRLGWSSSMSFVQGAIVDAELPLREGVRPQADVVLALHACDTATDDALARAVRWQAPVVLSAPCCHHDLQRRLRDSGATPSAVAPVLRHGLLRERLGDLLTDSWRALVLRLLGYRVEVVEFVDSAHTPRNVLLRAVRTGAPATPERWAEHDALSADWGVRPYLADILDEELDAARAR
ncbi:MAG: SAM-dependent methyltransferase [Actinomycetes bacterium]